MSVEGTPHWWLTRRKPPVGGGEAEPGLSNFQQRRIYR